MWDGAFAPTLRKSIGTVTFVPLSRMSQRDWEWLDFDNLREVAANRIANMAMSGNLTGFFRVMLIEKKAGPVKKEYLWPADYDMVERYGFAEESTDPSTTAPVPVGQAPNFFTYKPDIDTLDDAVLRLDYLRRRISTLTWPQRRYLIRLLIAVSSNIGHQRQEAQDKKKQEILDEIQELIVLLESTAQDADEYISFILTSVALWLATETYINDMVDDLVDIDDEQGATAWINKWVPLFAPARQQIAAGRGLT